MRPSEYQPRRLWLGAVLWMALGLVACDDAAPTIPEPETRLYAVVLADDQTLPATRECDAAVADVTMGTRFLEGDLTLFPGGSYRWRYTVEHFALSMSSSELWTQTVSAVGTYAIQGDTLELTDSRPGAGTRTGRIAAQAVELTEAIPCPEPVAGGQVHEAELYLAAAE